MHDLSRDGLATTRLRLRRNAHLLLLDVERLVELTGGAVGHDVDVVGVGLRGDAEPLQVLLEGQDVRRWSARTAWRTGSP